MRINRTIKSLSSRERGSVLMTTMVITSVIGITLGACLSLVSYQNKSVIRSQTWNTAMPVAEAGIEEALSQLQKNGPGGSCNLTVDNWTLDSSGYGKQRNVTSDSYYTVTISTAVPPTVTSKGFVLMPSSSNYVSRTVQVTTTNVPLFTTALAARFSLHMNGNGVATDSFNSADPNLSTNGQYDPTKVSTNGDVASVFGPVDLGNHTVNGSMYLGPTAQYNSGVGQVSGTIHTDLNVDFPDVVLPVTSWFLPGVPNLFQTINGTTYTYAFMNSGDFVIPISGTIYVGPNAKVRLNVTANNFSPGGVRVAGTGANSGQLTVYMSGASSTLGGNTTVDSGNAANFVFYGLPGCTTITYSGTSSFVGVIYAPEADLTLNGGGNGNGLIGASTTKSVTMNGHYDFHYDENLRNVGPSRGYLVASWDEL